MAVDMRREIIYCADGNERFADIALDAEFIYGAQPYRTTYKDIDFADIHPKHIPSLSTYANAVAAKKPRMATVMDWSRPEQLAEVLAWSEEVAPLVETVIIIPKVIGGITALPTKVGGKPIRLGYSVPSGHSGTPVPSWEFGDWPVHLLGGSPHYQKYLCHYMNVVSTDGNMAHKMATGKTQSGIVAVWQPNKRKYKKGHWVPLNEYRAVEFGLPPVDEDAPYVAFEYSSQNIMAMWRGSEC